MPRVRSREPDRHDGDVLPHLCGGVRDPRDGRRRRVVTKVRGDADHPGVAGLRVLEGPRAGRRGTTAPTGSTARACDGDATRPGTRRSTTSPDALGATSTTHGPDAVGALPRHRARLRRRPVRSPPATWLATLGSRVLLHRGHRRQRAGAGRGRSWSPGHADAQPGLGPGIAGAARARRHQPGRLARLRHHAPRPDRATSASTASGGGQGVGDRPPPHRDRGPRRRAPRGPARVATSRVLAAAGARALLDDVRRRGDRSSSRPRRPRDAAAGARRRSPSSGPRPRPASTRPTCAAWSPTCAQHRGRVAMMCGTGTTMCARRRARRVAALGAPHRSPARSTARAACASTTARSAGCGRRARPAGAGVPLPGPPSRPDLPRVVRSTRRWRWSTRSRPATSGRSSSPAATRSPPSPSPTGCGPRWRRLDVLAVVDVSTASCADARHPRAAGHRASSSGPTSPSRRRSSVRSGGAGDAAGRGRRRGAPAGVVDHRRAGPPDGSSTSSAAPTRPTSTTRPTSGRSSHRSPIDADDAVRGRAARPPTCRSSTAGCATSMLPDGRWQIAPAGWSTGWPRTALTGRTARARAPPGDGRGATRSATAEATWRWCALHPDDAAAAGLADGDERARCAASTASLRASVASTRASAPASCRSPTATTAPAPAGSRAGWTTSTR